MLRRNGSRLLRPFCSSRSNRERSLSYYGLPLKNKSLLKQWIHVIGRSNLPVNTSTRICSRHFVNAEGRRLYAGEVPSKHLPSRPTQSSASKKRKPPRERSVVEKSLSCSMKEATCSFQDQATNTDPEFSTTVLTLQKEVEILGKELHEAKSDLMKQQFRLANIADSDKKVCFYTGFPSYSALKVCFDFFGPSVNHLSYSSKSDSGSAKKGRPHVLSPLEEFFLTLVRLRLGLMEQDLADRFGVSQSTVSRITNTWINFLYLQFKEIDLWPSKDVKLSYMPKSFKDQYPSTRVIIDATEIYVEQPRLPELQQMTFSNYKNDNTYKALIGISPSGAIIFVSKLYPGSISD